MDLQMLNDNKTSLEAQYEPEPVEETYEAEETCSWASTCECEP